MTQPIQLTDQVYAVEVPDAGNAIITGNTITWKKGEAQGRGFIALPPGKWQLICTTKECTEDIAKGIVQVVSNGKISGQPQYRRYDRDLVKDTPAKCWTRDPRHAFETLLTSKGLDPNKNYVLIKKVS